LVIAYPLLADTIYFKNGTQAAGTIVSQSTTTLTLKTSTGNWSYNVSDIQRIEYGSASSTGTAQQTPAVPPSSSGTQPIIVMQQQQQQQQSGGQGLSLEQQWNNALFLAYAALEDARGYGGRIVLGLLLCGGLAAGSFYMAATVGDSGGAALLSICGLLFVVCGIGGSLWLGASGRAEVTKWGQEITRLQTIGQQKGWVYLGRYIPDPSQIINVNVNEDPAEAFGRVIGGVLQGLVGH
jgi:hypothetical protein